MDDSRSLCEYYTYTEICTVNYPQTLRDIIIRATGSDTELCVLYVYRKIISAMYRYIRRIIAIPNY